MATPPPLLPKGMTRTVGYFNNNNYPLRLNCTALGVQFTLERKGQYILQMVDGVPTKVNDPFFDQYCAPGFLSKEEMPQGYIAIRFLPRAGANPSPAQQAPASGPLGFGGTPNTGGTESSMKPGVSNTPGVGGMTKEEADKRGLFAPQAYVAKTVPLPESVIPAQPQGRPQPPRAAPVAPGAQIDAADAMSIAGPEPTLEESDGIPAQTIGSMPPPLRPAPILEKHPVTGEPIVAKPEAFVPQASANPAIQFGTTDLNDLPAPNLDPAPEAAPKPKNKGGRPRKNPIPPVIPA